MTPPSTRPHPPMEAGGGCGEACPRGGDNNRLGFKKKMALDKAKEIAASAPVVVFSKTYCGNCKRVKQLLTQLGANYKVFELDIESDGSEIQSALTEWTGQTTVPHVFAGGDHIGGCDGSKSIIMKLFQVLQDGSISRAGEILDIENLDVIKKSELSVSPTADTAQLISSSPKKGNHSTSSEAVSDSEDQEISDDDDDRNHKHRRREARPHSFDNDFHEQPLKRPNRKRNKPFDSGQLFLESNSQSSDVQKDYNPNFERNASSKFEKRHPGLTPTTRAASDLGQRARLNQAFRTDPCPRLDLSASTGRPPVGRGRGRSMVSWSQHDSRLNPHDTLEFASQIASQGPPTHPSLFVGTGLPSAASTQNASWGAYGFVPGMTNRLLDPLHPLGLQGGLQPPMNPLLNLGMPRQRCRDFEERGFCLRGDMCPMEHGVNRIVVEDVQSLSQFNLPVSIPNSHALGIQAGAGSLPPISAPSSVSTSSKAMPAKGSKSGVTDDALKQNALPPTSGVAEADVYDPDQPLWNNECPETSRACLRLQSPNNDDEPLWDADSSAHQKFRISDIENEHPSRSCAANISSENANSSVWGRIGPGNRSEMVKRTNNNVAGMPYLGNEMKEDDEEAIMNTPAVTRGRRVTMKEMGPKATAIQPSARTHADLGRSGGRAFQRASRTLFVNGIPLKNNRRDALLSHFQKFGQVVDIYIPFNSEKAFVQFSKKEEAEAALKAPDAVMGNRFIKLWWANRDRVSDDVESSIHNKFVQSPGMVVQSTLSQPSVTDRGKENLPSVAPKGGNAAAAETSVPTGGPPKTLLANGPKATPPVQKKLEGLELLKDELRKKQELLARKRDEFRRQLDKFEKQAISVKKGEVCPEQAGKRQKMDMGSEAAKPAAQRPANLSTTEVLREAEKTSEKSNSGEILVSPTSKGNLSTLQQSPTNIKQTSLFPTSMPHPDDLDNCPTSFKILPPLPEGLGNVAALKDHFSSFGDLLSVVLEDPEPRTEDGEFKPSHNCSASVTFTTSNSAKMAYLTGNFWRGHSLCCTWHTISPGSDKDCGFQEISTAMDTSSVETQAEQVTSGISSSAAGKSTCCDISEVASIRNGESVMDVDTENFGSISMPEALVQTHHSSSTKSSCEKQPPLFNVPMAEDETNTGFAE